MIAYVQDGRAKEIEISSQAERILLGRMFLVGDMSKKVASEPH